METVEYELVEENGTKEGVDIESSCIYLLMIHYVYDILAVHVLSTSILIFLELNRTESYKRLV
jgi:hypothetical protein